MVTRKLTLRTRPFQPFFSAATNLLNLARPYFDQIEANKRRYEETHVVVALPKGVWQNEKSLSIGSFMVKYAGLEALVNCTFEDFRIRAVDDLSNDYFVSPLSSIRGRLQGKSFSNWHLATRVFLVIPLCSNPEIDPRNIFDTTTEEWKKFLETVQIRHSFNHAKSGKTELVATKAGPNLWLANDQDPANFWPTTKTPRDHRILNYAAASALDATINWIVYKLRSALPTQLTDSYMAQEQGRVSNP